MIFQLQSSAFYLFTNLSIFKANGTARELQKRVEHLEKINIELKARLDESVAMYEQSQRDLRNKQQELQRTNAELDKTRELKDQLARENKKLGGEQFHKIQSTDIFPFSILYFIFIWHLYYYTSVNHQALNKIKIGISESWEYKISMGSINYLYYTKKLYSDSKILL